MAQKTLKHFEKTIKKATKELKKDPQSVQWYKERAQA